jgi:hypothetical protein
MMEAIGSQKVESGLAVPLTRIATRDEADKFALDGPAANTYVYEMARRSENAVRGARSPEACTLASNPRGRSSSAPAPTSARSRRPRHGSSTSSASTPTRP